MKKFLIGIVVVFVVVSVLSGLLHGVLLSGMYKQTASLWRPDMMNYMWMIHVATFIQSIGFVYIYYKLVSEKSPFRGLWYGLSFGITVGVGMAYVSYAMMPMPYMMALSWFIGAIVIHGIAGYVCGMIVKE